VLLLKKGLFLVAGTALLRIRDAVEGVSLEGEEAIGAQIVSKALDYPLRQLCMNAGIEGSLIVQEVLNRKGSVGYNVATETYEDLIKAGVVDPAKVTRSALQYAASVAGLLLTTEALVTDIPEENKGGAAAPDMGGMGGMGGMM
jgi:chaperonin GroEL